MFLELLSSSPYYFRSFLFDCAPTISVIAPGDTSVLFYSTTSTHCTTCIYVSILLFYTASQLLLAMEIEALLLLMHTADLVLSIYMASTAVASNHAQIWKQQPISTSTAPWPTIFYYFTLIVWRSTHLSPTLQQGSSYLLLEQNFARAKGLINFSIQVRETDLHLWQSPPRQVHVSNQSEGRKDVELWSGRQPKWQVKEERTWNIEVKWHSKDTDKGVQNAKLKYKLIRSLTTVDRPNKIWVIQCSTNHYDTTHPI